MNKQDLNQRMLLFQQQTPFPAELLHKDFYDWSRVALSYTNPVTAKIALDDFRQLIQKTQFSLYDIGFILSRMEIRSAREMEMTLPEYCDFLDAISDTVKEWRKILAPMQEQLQKEFDEAAQQHVDAGNVIALPAEA